MMMIPGLLLLPILNVGKYIRPRIILLLIHLLQLILLLLSIQLLKHSDLLLILTVAVGVPGTMASLCPAVVVVLLLAARFTAALLVGLQLH